jgi:sporulation protein YunB
MKRSHFWLIIFLLSIFATFQTFFWLDKYLRDPLMFLAKVRMTQMATEAVNQAMMEQANFGVDSNKMIQWKTSADGKVTGAFIDYQEQTRITAQTIQIVEQTLQKEAKLYARVPIGHALNSPFISSIGPSIGVRFHPASAVDAEVRTKQSSEGINTVLVEVYVHIKTEIAVLVPFDQDFTTLETNIPLSYMMVVGDVPAYYYDGNGNPVGSGANQAPALALPPVGQSTNGGSEPQTGG